MKIYTKTGDKGETSLYGGSRIEKNSLKVECYGCSDEANAFIGLAYSQINCPKIKKRLRWIQEKMFVLGAELASDEKGIAKLQNKIGKEDIAYLENLIDKYQDQLSPQNSFIIPGTSQGSASIHCARTIVRRMERNLLKLDKEKEQREEIKTYVNRLSDTLYTIARVEEENQTIDKIKTMVLERLVKMKTNDSSNFELWHKIVGAAISKSKEIGKDFAIAIVNQDGNLQMFYKMDDALLASTDISINKAYTAVALKMATHELTEASKTSLFGINTTNQNKIVSFGGGYPIVKNDRIIGAIGVSGGSVEEDMEVASYAISKI